MLAQQTNVRGTGARPHITAIQRGRRSVPFSPHQRQSSNSSAEHQPGTRHQPGREEAIQPGLEEFRRMISNSKEWRGTLPRLAGRNYQLTGWLFGAEFTRCLRDAIRASQRYHNQIETYLSLSRANLSIIQGLQEEAQAYIEENLFDHGLADKLTRLEQPHSSPSIAPNSSPEPSVSPSQNSEHRATELPVRNPELVTLPPSTAPSPDPNEAWYCTYCHQWTLL